MLLRFVFLGIKSANHAQTRINKRKSANFGWYYYTRFVLGGLCGSAMEVTMKKLLLNLSLLMTLLHGIISCFRPFFIILQNS